MPSSGTTEKPNHPGKYVKQRVIPNDMTVTKAAALLGIGRPALSNFLNGKAALSQEMARRLERAFGADREALLNLQAQYDRRDEAIRTPIVAGRHAPALIPIMAADIAGWAGRIDARRELPALLRKLIHTTGDNLTHVDFPAYDNAERPGRDGVVETTTPTPWIPDGRSVWEFGCDQRPGRKANGDYAKRVKSVPPEERRDTTFVFATPRNWPGKGNWVAEKAACGDWKDVRAWDASDLEQWLEQSAPTQIWFAERLDKPIAGFRSLDQCWSDWAGACNPALSPTLFDPAVKEFADMFRRWLGEPPERPFIVAADSRDEALAFVCRLVGDVKSRTVEPGAGALVFDKPEAIQRFRASNVTPRLAVFHNDSAEKEIGDLDRQCHCVIVRPGNDIDAEPDIKLGLPGWDAFSTAMKAMGLSDDKIDMLAREAGRSPTVLRRRLSKVPAIRLPAWAGNAETARKLLPAALAGAWRNTSDADREIIRLLAGIEDDNSVQNGFSELLALEDSPVWAAGVHRGAVSRLDALSGIAKFVTELDLDKFFDVAERVLSEPDPALELPEDERWTAALHDKVRNYSEALRKGIRETLVLLAVHGNRLFQNLHGIEIEIRVSALVNRLLTPLTVDRLHSHEADLPDYAEAAPDDFLELLEADLEKPEPAVFDLLKPVPSGLFGGCPRTGLLWALECLGWKHLGRVSPILARLSEVAIDDNWANKPIASLEALYRWWLPRTVAPVAERKLRLKTLAKRFPDIGWQVCLAQLNAGPDFAFHGYQPRWRDDAANLDQIANPQEIHEFRQEALELALSWPEHDANTLGDLVERLQIFPEEIQNRIWSLINAWAESAEKDKAKAALRERIRRFAFTRRARRQGVRGEMLDRARETHDRLEPDDPVVRHARLFGGSWFDLAHDEDEEVKIDYQEQAKKVRQLRIAAMKEIWTERGFEGVAALLSDCGSPDAVGDALESILVDAKLQVGLLWQCLSVESIPQERMDICIRGFLWSADDEARGDILAKTAEGAETERIIRLYCCAPFRKQTWRLLDRYDQEVRDRYWANVSPEWNRFDEAELIELVDRLLDAKRPQAAFQGVHLDWPRIDTARLKRILSDIVDENAKPEDHYRVQDYDISSAFEELDGRTGISRDEMVLLEFRYIQVLDHSKHGIPNLERRISESPADFVRMLALVFNRDDGKEDPTEWRVEDDQAKSALFSAAHNLFMHMSRIPGTGEGGEIDLEKLSDWTTETRRLCAEYGRADIGDEYIGQILSKGPAGDDGIRPCLPICEVMERVGSRDIGSGFRTGTINGRGVTSRAVGEGGEQERELAEQYRSWSRQRSPEYPFVGKVLEDIAAHYDLDAKWHDDDAEIKLRTGH